MNHKLAFVLACLAFALYARAAGFGFINGDDYAFILENPVIKTHVGFLSLWSDPINHLYAPLSYSLWFLVSALFGMQAGAFHLLSALLHAGSTATVYFAVLRVLDARGETGTASRAISGNQICAALSALVFAFHPVQVESVAWASETKDILFTLLSLVAIDTYLRFSEARDAQAVITSAQVEQHRKRLKAKDSIKLEASSSRATRLYATASIFFILALLAKPAAVVVPAILFAIDTLLLDRPWPRALRSLGAWFGVAAVFALATTAIQPATDIAHASPLWFRPVVALDTLTTYLDHVLWPLQLGADYGRTPEKLLASGAYHLTAPIGAAIILAAGVGVRFLRGRWIAGALAVFALGFLPVSGLVSFDYQQYTTVTDHYLYLPMFGVALGVGLALQAVSAAMPALALAGVAVLALASLSWQTSANWRDNQTIYAATLKLNPDSFMSYNNLGQAQEEEGKLDAALETYRQAVRVKPGYLPAENNIGNVLYNQGHVDEAIAHYARVISSGEITDPPGHTAARIYNNYAAALAKRGRLPEAMAAVQRAVAIDPGFADARGNLQTLMAAMNPGAR